MPLLTESANPFNYMSNLWTFLIIILIVCIILFFLARPLHRYLTDRKTRTVIEESGASEELPAAGPAIPEKEKPEGEEK